MEVYRNYGHFELLDNTYHIRLPPAVYKPAAPVDLGDSSGREEPQRTSAPHLVYGLPDAVYGYGFLGRIVGGHSIYSNEIRLHSPNSSKNHVDHDLVLGTPRGYQMYQRDAVKCAEGVIGDCDKRTLGQVVKHVKAVNAQLYVEVAQQPFDESRTGCLAVVGMDGVDLVYAEPMQQPLDQATMAGQLGHHGNNVIGIQHCCLAPIYDQGTFPYIVSISVSSVSISVLSVFVSVFAITLGSYDAL